VVPDDVDPSATGAGAARRRIDAGAISEKRETAAAQEFMRRNSVYWSPGSARRETAALRNTRVVAGTLPVAHQHPFARCTYPHIVGIITKLDARDRGQILPPQDVHRTVTGIGHKYAIRKGSIGNALRLAETGDSAQYLARCQIDHA
jgi:hypothetical protein